MRNVIFELCLDETTDSVLMVYWVNGAPCAHFEDPAFLPLIDGMVVPEEWAEHVLRGLTVALPPETGGPSVTEVGLARPNGDHRGSVMHPVLGISSRTRSRTSAKSHAPTCPVSISRCSRLAWALTRRTPWHQAPPR